MYLAVSLTLEPTIVANLLADLPKPAGGDLHSSGFSVAPVTDELLDAWVRMLRLMDRPADIPALAPAYERELLYRILQGPHGWMLRDIASPGTALSRIGVTIRWIRENFTTPLRVEALASMAALSVSAFHGHFKAVTALSPLQYQKRVRLLHARNMFVAGEGNTTSVAFRVGYERSRSAAIAPPAVPLFRAHVSRIRRPIAAFDVAAGTGALALSAARTGAKELATDFSPGMVARIAAANVPNAEARAMDGQALALDDGSFDAVFSIFGVIMFPDWRKGLAEMARVTRPGRYGVVATWQDRGAATFLLLGQIRRKLFPDCEGMTMPEVVQALSEPEDFSRELMAAGYQAPQIEYVTHDYRLDVAALFAEPDTLFGMSPDWTSLSHAEKDAARFCRHPCTTKSPEYNASNYFDFSV